MGAHQLRLVRRAVPVQAAGRAVLHVDPPGDGWERQDEGSVSVLDAPEAREDRLYGAEKLKATSGQG